MCISKTWNRARKSSPTPDMRKKYQEKVSQPLLPTPGRAVIPNLFTRAAVGTDGVASLAIESTPHVPYTRSVSLRRLTGCEVSHYRRTVPVLRACPKDRCQDKDARAYCAEYAQYQDDIEHLLLEFVADGPEVHQNNTNTVKGVVEKRADEGEGENAEWRGAEDFQGIVVHGWPKA